MTIRQNLTIRQKETWSYVYTYGGDSPVNLTGYTCTFTINGWGTGTVALGGATGTVTLSLTSAQTYDLGNAGTSGFGAYADHVDNVSGCNIEPLERKFTVNLTDGSGEVTRVLEGLAIIIRDAEV